jgi:uracil-DNA glycosylase family 4
VARVKRKAYRDQEYWGRAVPGFGDLHARVLVVGLAPGAHGSNRTGRVFTGDASGGFLFPALYRAGFANQPIAESKGDGLMLKDLYICAVAHCVPPDNKPTRQELDNCQPYLERSIQILKPKVIVCLGSIAFDRLLRILSARNPAWKFGHGSLYRLQDGTWILCSYHPSQQNTLTGRLTAKMFDEIWAKAKELMQDE